MAMHNLGLTKLQEECGELTQIAAKKSAYLNTDEHPDGKGSMAKRLEDEIADVMAACEFVANKTGLDIDRINDRRIRKYDLFREWDSSANV